jgi:importin subunit beta-1
MIQTADNLLHGIQSQAEGTTEVRQFYNFARIATNEVVPVLLELLTHQDEDAADDEYNVSRAAYQCIQLWAQCTGGQVVAPVLQFIEKNLRAESWNFRDAAVSAFGAIMEGPDDQVLLPIVKQGLSVLISMMNDPNLQVKDSTAYTLGRICETCPEGIDLQQHFGPLITSLFQGLSSHPKMAASCCWALMNLADRFAGEPGAQSNPISQYFGQSISHILQVTER